MSIVNSFASLNSAPSNFARLFHHKAINLVDWVSSLLTFKASASVKPLQQIPLSIPKSSHAPQTIIDDKTSSTVIRSSTKPFIPQGFYTLPIKSMMVKDFVQALVIIAYTTLGLVFHKVQLGTTVMGAIRRSIIYNNLSMDLKALYDEIISIGQALRSLTLRPMVPHSYIAKAL